MAETFLIGDELQEESKFFYLKNILLLWLLLNPGTVSQRQCPVLIYVNLSHLSLNVSSSLVKSFALKPIVNMRMLTEYLPVTTVPLSKPGLLNLPAVQSSCSPSSAISQYLNMLAVHQDWFQFLFSFCFAFKDFPPLADFQLVPYTTKWECYPPAHDTNHFKWLGTKLDMLPSFLPQPKQHEEVTLKLN